MLPDFATKWLHKQEYPVLCRNSLQRLRIAQALFQDIAYLRRRPLLTPHRRQFPAVQFARNGPLPQPLAVQIQDQRAHLVAIRAQMGLFDSTPPHERGRRAGVA